VLLEEGIRVARENAGRRGRGEPWEGVLVALDPERYGASAQESALSR
jgi:hypothetical protein